MQLTAEQRIKACMLIEQMKKMSEYCEEIGIANKSILHPEQVTAQENN